MTEATAETLRIGTAQEPDTLHPILSTMSASMQVRNMVLRPIMALDQVSKVTRCFLCIDKQKSGDQRDQRFEVHWTIRDDAFWGDGKLVTGYDMHLAWEIGTAKNVANPSPEPFQKVIAVEVDEKNPRQFTLVYAHPEYDSLDIDINFVPLPSHIEGPIFARTKDRVGAYEKETAYLKDPYNTGLYNGPYTLKEHQPGSHLVLKRNQYFRGAKNSFDTIIFRVASDSTLWLLLQAGDIDMTSAVGVSIEQALTLEEQFAASAKPHKFEVLWNKNLTVEKIAFNMLEPPTDDLGVRHALMLAIDRPLLVASIFRNRLTAAFRPYHNSSPYGRDVAMPTHDLVKAGELLEKSGWLLQKDGSRSKEGKPLTLTLSATANNKTRELVEIYLQNQWKKIGAGVTIKNETARQYYGRTLWRREYGHVALFATNLWNTQDILFGAYHSTMIASPKNNWSGGNVMGWRNTLVDQALEKASKTVDLAKRVQLLNEVDLQFAKDVPAVPLFEYSSVVLVRSGLEFGGSGNFPDSLSVESWKVLHVKNSGEAKKYIQ